MNRYFLLILLILGISFKASAVYDLNENCKEAWMLLMDLKIEDAKSILADEINKNPNNHYAYYLDQTCDAYKLLINSNQQDYKDFVDNYAKKREIMDAKDEESPYYLSCSSEMELQVGIFNIIHDDRFSGLRKAYSAYKNVYRNLEKYPSFKPSLKLDGFFNVAISNLPPFVKWAAAFFGVSADPVYGFKTLNENYQSQKDIKGINAESALYIILVSKINKTPEMAYDFTKSLDSSISKTFIHTYFRANLAYRTGNNEEALSTLQQIDIKEYVFADIIYSYLMGKILLRKLDEQSDYFLSRYLLHLEKKEYVKEMNYSLALYYLINGDTKKYKDFCEIVRDEGTDINERDREALYEANLDYIPNVNLSKARLLLDGGYITNSWSYINKYELNKSEILGDEIEYHLLKARLEYSEEDIDMAITEFTKVIEMGEDTDYSFACQSALLLGNIYEENGETELAKEYYKKSIKYFQDDFYEYLEDKASKGLKRLKD